MKVIRIYGIVYKLEEMIFGVNFMAPRAAIKSKRRRISDVDGIALSLHQIQARKDLILRNHRRILERVRSTGRVTDADRVELEGSNAQLLDLNERETQTLTSFTKLATRVDGFAQTSSQQLERFKQGLDQMATRQGAGIVTILIGIPVGYALYAQQVAQHNKTFPDQQHGYSLPSRDRRNRIAAVRRGRDLHNLPS